MPFGTSWSYSLPITAGPEPIHLSEKSLALIGNASGRTGGKGGRLAPRRFR